MIKTDTIMKKIGFIYLLTALLSIGFAACTEPEGDGGNTPEFVFSEMEGLDMTLLEETDEVVGSFTVDAIAAWSLESDQPMWVTFSNSVDGEFYSDIPAEAGKRTVYVKISNAGRGYNAEQAVIKAYSNDKEYLIATVVRPGKKWLNITAENGDAVEAIELGENATATFRFQALFECAIVKYPEWIVEPVMETDGTCVLSVVGDEETLQNPLEGELLVSTKDNTIQCVVPVKYSGMNPAIMEISGDSPWNWLVSTDGKKIRSKQAMDSVVIKESLEMKLRCRSNAYKIVFAEEQIVYSEEGEVVDSILCPKSGDEAWIKAVRSEIDPKVVTVAVAPSDTEMTRSGYLFAVPDAAYEAFYEALALGKNTSLIVDEYQGYVLAQMEQRVSGFAVSLVEDGAETKITCEVDEQADYYVIVASDLFSGTDPDVSACDVELGKSYVINTRLTNGRWNPKKISLFDINYEDINLRSWVTKENGKPDNKAVLGEDGFYRIYITVPESLVIDEDEDPEKKYDNNIVLMLHSEDDLNLKALVLRVQE